MSLFACYTHTAPYCSHCWRILTTAVRFGIDFSIELGHIRTARPVVGRMIIDDNSSGEDDDC